MDQQHIFAVSESNGLIKDLIDVLTPQLSGLYIRGELVQLPKIYPSGHHYHFTRTDRAPCGASCSKVQRPEAAVPAGKRHAGGGIRPDQRVPPDGASAVLHPAVPGRGGDLYVAFEQLKQKLQQEGLFDPAHKKPLPFVPPAHAIVTSGAGAAVHDMIRIIRRRYPLAKCCCCRCGCRALRLRRRS